MIFAKIFVFAKSCAKIFGYAKFFSKILFFESFYENMSKNGANARGSLTFFAINFTKGMYFREKSKSQMIFAKM
jgi:hypothetical protein